MEKMSNKTGMRRAAIPLVQMNEMDRRAVIEKLAQSKGLVFEGYERRLTDYVPPSLIFKYNPFRTFVVRLSFDTQDGSHDLTLKDLAYTLKTAIQINKQMDKIPVHFSIPFDSLQTLSETVA
jgi:hypothetical protein